MRLGVSTKQPAERISKSIFYTRALDEGDSIATINSCTATPSGDPEDLEVSPVLVDVDRVRIWIQKGKKDVTYKITILVSTNNGEIFEDELVIPVREI